MVAVEFTTFDGAKLAGVSIGDGAPVILLHGAGQTRHAWRRTAERLAQEGYRALTFDARGHGESDWAVSGGYGLDLFANDLCAVMRELDGPPPALVGASLGGLTAMVALGRKGPPPASALVLVDIAVKIQSKGSEQIQAFMRANPDGFETVEDAVEAVNSYMTDRSRPKDASSLHRNLRERDGRFFWHWDPELMRRRDEGEASIGSAKTDLDAAARRVKVPAMLIRGENSKVIDQSSVDHMKDLIDGLNVVVLKDAGHMVVGDANTEFSNSIINFLQKHVPA